MPAIQSPAVSVVLVHGGFVDGTGWEGVYGELAKKGYDVSIVQNPTISLEDDVAVTRRVIAHAKGPVVLVGHSYGGVIARESGRLAGTLRDLVTWRAYPLRVLGPKILKIFRYKQIGARCDCPSQTFCGAKLD